MSPFNGISAEVFASCQKSEKLRIPINILKDLQRIIEPELQKINPEITGHVSRIKKRASNNYRDWAWLYFNTHVKEAYRYSELAVNISPNHMFVGIGVRNSNEYKNYKDQIMKPENAQLLENLASTLSTRELFFSIESGTWDDIPRKHSVEELKGLLLTPNLFWINIPFEKDDPKLTRKELPNEIVEIFKDLYNVFAFASGNKTIQQAPNKHPFVPQVVVDNNDLTTESDDSDELLIADFIFH
jgi:uncharacterized protein YktB (UPF0637 family)